MYQPKLFDAPYVDFAPEIVIAADGIATYDRYFLEPDVADGLFETLRTTTPWKQEHLAIYGRRVPFPRLTAWYGDRLATYVYSGVRNAPHPWTGQLTLIRDRLFQATQVRFNSVLLNFYRDGNDSLGWHSDDEPELGIQPVIASVSLGAPRLFQLRHKSDHRVVSILLEHGSLLMMTGQLQEHWAHRVPKQRDESSARINLTFRVVDARNDSGATLQPSRKRRAPPSRRKGT